MNVPVRPPVVLTDDQYEDMTRRGAFVKVGRVELRGGVIVAMNPVFYPHARVADELQAAFREALRRSGSPLQATREISVHFGGGFQPTADITIWDPALAPADLDGPLPGGAVKLVVEVSDSSLGDDLGDKLLNYAAAGLPEYWVADVKARVVFLHAGPGPAGYATRTARQFGETIAALTIPLAVDTAAL